MTTLGRLERLRRVGAQTAAALFALSAALAGVYIARADARDPAARAAALSVSASGNDAKCARGAAQRPCATLGRAYALAQPGDVVAVAPGSYPPQVIAGAKPSGPPVVFRATGRPVVVAGRLQLGLPNGAAAGNAPSNVTLSGIDVNGGLSVLYQTGPPPARIVVESAHIWNTASSSGALIDVQTSVGVRLRNLEVGPACCDSDGIDVTIPRVGAASPADIRLDHVYVHDLYDTCTAFPSSLGSCSGTGFGDGSSAACAPGCDHVDGSQWFGGVGASIVGSRFFRAGSQAIFLQSANGGTFSDVTLENNVVGPLCCGGVNAVSISGPGTAVVGGDTRILYNTVQGPLRLYGDAPANAIWAPGAHVAVIGNVVGSYSTSLGNGCKLQIGGADGLLEPEYVDNLFGNQRCGPSDVRGSPEFAPAASDRTALQLARGSRGLGLGSVDVHPQFDIDGRLRPLQGRPDAGAFQRESAQIVLGVAVGAARIGATRSSLVDFYGAPRRRSFARRPGGKVEIDSYRLHGGGLSITYAGGTAVGVKTTSSYYTTTGGLGVGAPIPHRQTAACRGNVVRWRAGRTLVLVGRDRRGRIRSLEFVERPYARC